MFEHRTSPVLPRKAFLRRMRRSILISTGIAAVTLAVGMLGYRLLERLNDSRRHGTAREFKY
jgi:hypothetical protein